MMLDGCDRPGVTVGAESLVGFGPPTLGTGGAADVAGALIDQGF